MFGFYLGFSLGLRLEHSGSRVTPFHPLASRPSARPHLLFEGSKFFFEIYKRIRPGSWQGIEM